MARLSLGARRGEAGQWLVAVAKPRWHECSCYLRAPSPCARASLLSAYPMPMPTRAPATCVPHARRRSRRCSFLLSMAMANSITPHFGCASPLLAVAASPPPPHRPLRHRLRTAPFAIASALPPSPSPPHCPLRHRLRTAPFAIVPSTFYVPISRVAQICACSLLASALLVIWWLRKGLTHLPASRLLPVEYGTVTSTSIIGGLVLFKVCVRLRRAVTSAVGATSGGKAQFCLAHTSRSS